MLNESTTGVGADQPDAGFDDHRTTIGIRTARYSYIRNRSVRDELYDLRADPTQETNLIGDDRYRRVRRVLRLTWWEVRNCSGAQCRVALPTRLQADPPRLDRLTDHYWEVIRRTYGFR